MSTPLRPILPPDVRDFYVRARAQTYAAGMSPAPTPILPGAHELRYAEAVYLYEDRYFDNPAERPGSFVGIELVRLNMESNPVIASCSYGGGLTADGLRLTGDAAVGQFLQLMLGEYAERVRFGEMLRVDRHHDAALWVYADEGEVQPWGWRGAEHIWRDGVLVYSLGYQGGCFVPGF
jgi:hypothetical protein